MHKTCMEIKTFSFFYQEASITFTLGGFFLKLQLNYTFDALLKQFATPK